MLHLIAQELADMAEHVEKEFFRIEKENRFLASLINGLIAGMAVGLVAWLMMSFQDESESRQGGDLLLFACLGSSSAAIVFAPLAKTNSLRSIILSYLASAVVCLLLFPVKSILVVPVPVQCILAVSLSIVFMRLINALHPAAVGSALAFIIFEQRDIRSLLLLLLAIMGLLTIVKVLAYTYREELTFRDFHREFRRTYYGTELTVTVSSERTDESGDHISEPNDTVPEK